MKIALTVDPEIPVPPLLYGGIERIAAMLADGLAARGHEVFLFAHPDSKVACRHVAWPGRSSLSQADSLRNAALLALHAARERFDVVHSFSRVAYLLPLLGLPIPKLMSYQREISARSVRWGHRLSRGTLAFTSVGRHLIRGLEHEACWHVVPNGVPVALYTPVESVPADAPLIFLGRIEPIKGTHIAIDVARRCARTLVIAGNIADVDYFERTVRPQVDGVRIRYVGPVNDTQKDALLGAAAALLMPVQWEEPFGIVMAEALACGTPVIGLNRGAVAEVVEEGKTGFVCSCIDAMVAAVAQLPVLSRRRCRQSMEQRFSDTVIVEQYEGIYRELLRD